jgi:glutaminyl-peptide cyclotransferase
LKNFFRSVSYSLCFFEVLCCVAACSRGSNDSPRASLSTASASPSPAGSPPSEADAAPPPDQTGGFDGKAAYEYTAKLVSFGPRPPASEAIRQTQDYILAMLKSFGCPIDVDDFHASTPIGDLAMKNIIVKISGSGPGILLLLTHYDTVRIPDFVGADDAGSSSGLMLEMSRVLCSRKERKPNSVWIAFLDGEEAQVVQDGVAQWTDEDSVFGSRELAAEMDLSGDLKRVRAVLLADMVGAKGLNIRQDPGSTPWLNSLVWKTADRLGYRAVFIAGSNGGVQDDHTPFLSHHVPAADITEFPNYPFWHTTQDTMDKISARSLAIAGHVFLATLEELQRGER